MSDTATKKEFKEIKNILKANGRAYFEQMMKAHQLDGVLSINNYHAGYAAVAEYPALTVPMGLSKHVSGLVVTVFATSLSYFVYRTSLPAVSSPPRIEPFRALDIPILMVARSRLLSQPA